MAHLTKATQYNIEDSNIALLGSDLEKNVRAHAGDREVAWDEAGKVPGTQIWRIEKFTVKEWPKTNYGRFYDGDSYIVLHTYKKDPDNEDISYDLHFWLGEETSQDEAGTAAYKTVELDDHLGGKPVQYREVQGYESPRFLSYFPKFTSLHGGVASGFHHVSEPPPDNTRRLYRISAPHAGIAHVQVREVPAAGASVVQGSVFVLDMGPRVWQFNTEHAAAEFVQSLVSERQSQCDATVYGACPFRPFRRALGPSAAATVTSPHALFRLSDASGEVVFDEVAPATASSLTSDDAFVLDASADAAAPAVYVWVGAGASLTERRLALQYGQRFLYAHRAQSGRAALATHIVRMAEGQETDAFRVAIGM
ncbi:fragmin60 [Epithele typhae]|uniref:fragmin60 n=1 Tax=Epithele typhae TaxID=378194 RepID=UPI0020072909|nr:fragmin60 [Epithele typhae]KAH9931681.1 fragmin60 [Epithele typhae]